MAVLGLRCCKGFSLVEASGDSSPVAVLGPLIMVASLIVEHGLWGARASVTVVHRLRWRVGSSRTRG